MTQVERDGDGFVVPATLLAEVFRMNEDEVRQAMRDGTLTSNCEAGVRSDSGRWRLTFCHANRACRYAVDAACKVLSASRFPVRIRPILARD